MWSTLESGRGIIRERKVRSWRENSVWRLGRKEKRDSWES